MENEEPPTTGRAGNCANPMKESTKQRRWTAVQPAASLIVEVLQQLGFACALCGDFACCLYGEFRVPIKVEVVVFIPGRIYPAIDALKQTIACKSNGRLHLDSFDSARPRTSSLGLCYRHEPSPGTKRKTVNIELRYCHDATSEQVWYMHGFPLAPLSFLLLRKLEKWEGATITKQQQIFAMDVLQLQAILEMYRLDDIPFSSELHESSRKRIRAFSSAFPESAHTLRKLGFDPILVDTSQAAAAAPHFEELGSSVVTQDTEQFMIENPSRIQMVFLAGLTAVGILRKLGYSCAIYGSLACFLYGNPREPNDVDILALPPSQNTFSIEDLKLAIARVDPVHFYLIPSKRPGATYQMLYYRLSNVSNAQTVSTSCKVDLVFPGTLRLPALPSTHISWDEGLPLVPFSLLLLQKLQGWDDHRISGEHIKRLKQTTDAGDIKGLLGLSETVPLQFSRPWSDRLLFDEEFETLSRERVKLYCSMFPECAESWGILGFD